MTAPGAPEMAGKFTIGEVFFNREVTGWNALQRWSMARMVMPNEDSTNGFFTKHGMVSQTDVLEDSSAPIQMVRGLEDGGKRMSLYLEGFLSGEPALVDKQGFAPPAEASQRTIPQTEFYFETTEFYAPSLFHPTLKQENDVATSIIPSYYNKLTQYWSDLADEMLVIYASGFRGEGQSNKVFGRQRATGNQNAQSLVSGFTETMKKMNDVNEIKGPTRLFSGADAVFAPNNAINANNFSGTDASQRLTWTKLANLQAYRDNQKQGIADWELKPGTFRVKPTEKNGEAKMDTTWSLVVSPEIARDVMLATGTQSWYEHQLAAAAARGYNTGLSNGIVGLYADTLILKYHALSKYLGGAAGDVPVARCLMMGAQSLVFGYQGKMLPEKYLPRGFGKMRETIMNYGLPVETWVGTDNRGRNSGIESCANLGFKKVQFEGPNYGGMHDKGMIAIDFPYSGGRLYA